MQNKSKVDLLLQFLEYEFPEVNIPLNHTNAHELLFATILSAQCTDERVNKITPALFARFPKLSDYAAAEVKEIEELIKTCGLFRNKAKNIHSAAKMIVSDFDEEVPNNLQDLIMLPGVAKKTATVVLWQWFGINAGITVDTHVKRVATLFGLSTTTNPDKIAADLEKIIPQEKWGITSLRLVMLGRHILTSSVVKQKAYIGTKWEQFVAS